MLVNGPGIPALWTEPIDNEKSPAKQKLSSSS